MPPAKDVHHKNDTDQTVLFGNICDDLVEKSYSVQQNALPEVLIKLLTDRVNIGAEPKYKSAGIGRETAHHKNQNVRRDEISWINDILPTDKKWNNWTDTLRVAINRDLF